MCMASSPPHGIPIPEEVHQLYSDELKKAWHTFHEWWEQAYLCSDSKVVSRSNMPEEVRQAMDLILETPIPGYEEEGITGKDSCYMIGVNSIMFD